MQLYFDFDCVREAACIAIAGFCNSKKIIAVQIPRLGNTVMRIFAQVKQSSGIIKISIFSNLQYRVFGRNFTLPLQCEITFF